MDDRRSFMTEVERTPTPGSPEALESGCTCSVVDNSNGKGIQYKGTLVFNVAVGCPIHDLSSATDVRESSL